MVPPVMKMTIATHPQFAIIKPTVAPAGGMVNHAGMMMVVDMMVENIVLCPSAFVRMASAGNTAMIHHNAIMASPALLLSACPNASTAAAATHATAMPIASLLLNVHIMAAAFGAVLIR